MPLPKKPLLLYIMILMKEHYLFLKRFFSKPSTVGSLFPSSKKLATEITRKAGDRTPSPVSFLEVGAGLGAFTDHIVTKMRAQDTLDIVESDPQFCKILKSKYGHHPRVSIHQISILDFRAKDFDFIISSLPLNAFHSDIVDQMLFKYKNLSKPGGYISYFEYMGIGRLKKLYLSGEMQKDFCTTLSLKRSFVENYCREMDKIWSNLPPARVFHCQM